MKCLSQNEIINFIRNDIRKEEDATLSYTTQASKIPGTKVAKVLISIANEERVHIGELTRLLELIAGEKKYLKAGAKEVKQRIKR